MEASPCQILVAIGAAMLSRQNMVGLMSLSADGFRKQTILTATAGTLGNALTLFGGDRRSWSNSC